MTFDIEVIGGFPWVDADISISNTEAVEILEHNCTGTIEVKQSCQVIARVSDTTEALYADLNIINSFPSHKTIEIENGLLSRVTQLSTGMLKIDFIALQDVQGINLMGLNDDKWSVNTNIANGCAVSGGMALNAGESCSIQLLQHPVYRYFTTGTYSKEMTIPTSIGDFSMTVNLEGQLAIPDKTTNQLFMYKVNGNELSFEREIPLSVPVGHMLANPFGYLYVTDADNGDIYRYNLLHDNIEKVYNSEGAHGISSLILRESIFLNNAYNLHVVYEDGTLLQLRERGESTPEISTYNLGYADSFYHVSRSNQSNNTVYLTRSSMTGMAAIQTINLTSPLVTTTDDQIATNLIGASSIFRSNNRYFGLDSDNKYYRSSRITLGGGRQLDFASDQSKDIQLGLDVSSGLDVLIAPAKGGGIMTFDKNASQPGWQRNRNATEKDDFGDTTAILPSDNHKVFAFSSSEITEAVSVFTCSYIGPSCSYKSSYKSMDGFKLPADANDEAMTVIQFLSATQLRPVV